jgi:hypothetical protein
MTTASEYNLSVGDPQIASAGVIAFGPGDVLFLADNQSARIVALDVADPSPSDVVAPVTVDNLDAQLALLLDCALEDVAIRGMAVHPRTNNVYLSVMGTRPALVRVDCATGALREVELTNVAFCAFTIDNAPSLDDDRTDIRLGEGEEVEYNGRKFRISRPPIRQSTITDMAYVDGTLLVAGLSNEEFSSNLRKVPFPFAGGMDATSLEIFHVSHGKWETAAPIRTFVPYGDGASILASYTCTPLVHFPLADLTAGAKATGRTVAELGAGNQPLDIVAYQHDGTEYVLVSNSTHPLMKIACADIDSQAALTQPQEPVGVPRTNSDIRGVSLMANLNGEYIVGVQTDKEGQRHLRTLETASV